MPNPYGQLAQDPTTPPPQGPQLPPGIGNDQQATQATAYIRQQPWYLQWLQSQGIRPGADGQVKLSDDQAKSLYNLALQHGIGLNDKYDQFDENGQISEGHHLWRNIGIGAAIGGLALTGLGAAGIGPLAGALGGGAGAAGAAGAGLGADAAGVGATAGLATGAGVGTAIAAPTIADISGLVAGGGLAGIGAGAGVSGAAGIAGAGAPSWLGPAIGAGGNLLGTVISANANSNAAELNQKYLEDALAYEKERDAYTRSTEANRYGALTSGLSPYRSTGTAANARMADLLGLPTPASAPMPANQPMTGMGSLAATTGGMAAPGVITQPIAPAPTIMMQAPDGSTQQVPADQEGHWTQMGARRVGGGL